MTIILAIALLGQPDNAKIHADLAAMRAADPLRFDASHPFVGRLLSDQTYFQEIKARYELNPPRFAANHPFVWRVLDGGPSHHPHVPPPPPPPPIPPDCDGPKPPVAIPEPASAVLLPIGLALAMMGVRRWNSKRVTT